MAVVKGITTFGETGLIISKKCKLSNCKTFSKISVIYALDNNCKTVSGKSRNGVVGLF